MMTDSDSDSGNEVWSYDSGLSGSGLPDILWEVLQYLGYPERPIYAGQTIEQGGVTMCKVGVNIEAHPQHPDWESGQWHMVSHDFQSGRAKVAQFLLALFCEARKDTLAGTKFEMLPVRDWDGQVWQRRLRRMARTDATHHCTATYAWRMTDLLDSIDHRAALYLDRARDLQHENHVLGVRLHESEQQVQELTDTLADRAVEVDMLTIERDDLIRERDALVTQRNAVVEERDELSGELAARTAVLQQRNNYITHLQAHVGTAQQAMDEMAGQIEGLEAQVEQLQQQLQAALAPPPPVVADDASDVDYEDPQDGPQ